MNDEADILAFHAEHIHSTVPEFKEKKVDPNHESFFYKSRNPDGSLNRFGPNDTIH